MKKILKELYELMFLIASGIMAWIFMVLPVTIIFSLVALAFSLSWGILAVFQGWILQHLWEWFAVPEGFGSLSITRAIGISLIFNLLQSHMINLQSKKELFEQTIFWGAGQLLILSAGYVIKQFFLT